MVSPGSAWNVTSSYSRASSRPSGTPSTRILRISVPRRIIGGTRTARRQGAQQSAHQPAVERRRGALAADVAQGDDSLPAALLEDIVDVARNLARRPQAN